jgi:8-oxo-dGTP pyrophosphatase MutT (NUDIX family)
MNEDETIIRLERSLNTGLPGEKAHVAMLPLNRALTSVGLKEAEKVRKSAVGIILYPSTDGIDCILIQRPKYEGMHSDQMAFPGGKMDSDDLDLEYTARRECYEEIALPTSEGILLGELTKVYIPVSGFVIYPFIFHLDQVPVLAPDNREVAEIVTFPLLDILKTENVGTMPINFPQGTRDVPCFNLANKQVWGATALILNELKEVLLKI